MIYISGNRCVGCGLCVNVRPEQIKMNVEEGIAEIVGQNEDCLKKAIKVCPQKAIRNIDGELIFAIGTDDKATVKSGDHVGMSKYFQIWKYSEGSMALVETRENAKYQEDEERIHGDPKKAEATASVLDGVDIIVGKIIGPNIVRLKKRFILAVLRENDIQKGIESIKSNINEILEEKEKGFEERKALILH